MVSIVVRTFYFYSFLQTHNFFKHFFVLDPEKNFHFVVDCAKKVMKEHCYWPLVSDFNNVLSHERVAQVFLKDDNLIDMWFQFLSMLQGN